jgi:hypothetical protein
MTQRSTDQLQALLFASERTLKNIKFFPGTGQGLDAVKMSDVAAAAIASALARGVDEPPVSGRKKSAIL